VSRVTSVRRQLVELHGGGDGGAMTIMAREGQACVDVMVFSRTAIKCGVISEVLAAETPSSFATFQVCERESEQ
jgi:hypothetical protein